MSRRWAGTSRVGIVAAALALAAAWCPAALAATPDTVLSSCSFSALKSAVAGGGTVDYGVSCPPATPVSFTSAITVPRVILVTLPLS